jgi:hypothetical protein
LCNFNGHSSYHYRIKTVVDYFADASEVKTGGRAAQVALKKYADQGRRPAVLMEVVCAFVKITG